MGFIDTLGKVGSAVMYALIERAVEISPEKMPDYTIAQLEALCTKGNPKTRDWAMEELRKRKKRK